MFKTELRKRKERLAGQGKPEISSSELEAECIAAVERAMVEYEADKAAYIAWAEAEGLTANWDEKWHFREYLNSKVN